MQKQKQPNSAGVLSVFSPHPPFLNKETCKKIEKLCIQNQIDIETFTVELLRLALNQHEKEIQEIIKNLKVK